MNIKKQIMQMHFMLNLLFKLKNNKLKKDLLSINQSKMKTNKEMLKNKCKENTDWKN